MADTILLEDTKVKRAEKEEMGQVVLRVRRLRAKDFDRKKPREAERIFQVISQLITNEGVLDFSVLSDPRTVVLGIFEGVVVDGAFTDPYLIGMATANFKHTWTGWKIEVDDVVVYSRNRGKGVGRVLMDAVEELGRQHKPPCKVAVLQSDRPEAWDFYFHRGYLMREGRLFKKPLKQL